MDGKDARRYVNQAHKEGSTVACPCCGHPLIIGNFPPLEKEFTVAVHKAFMDGLLTLYAPEDVEQMLRDGEAHVDSVLEPKNG